MNRNPKNIFKPKNNLLKPTNNLLKPTLTNQATDFAKKTMDKGKELTNKITNVAKSTTNNIKEGVQKKVDNVQKKITNITEKPEIKEPLSKWSTMTQEFLSANTAISKFVSFILLLLLFVILFQVGVGILQYFIGPQYNPYILNGMVPSNIQTVISSNPNIKNSVPIYRSVDAPQGIEYSWNVWFLVSDANTITNNKGVIFSKGTSMNNSININNSSTNINTNTNAVLNPTYLNVAPGLFIVPNKNENDLVLVMNTYDSAVDSSDYYETITVANIPMQKWVCCTIRVQGTYVDVYINGVLTQRKILMNIPKQNYYDTYVGDPFGFTGYISSLRYYASAISYDEIQSLFASGPSLKMLSSSTMPISNDFLSMNWYYNYTSST